MGLLDIEKLRFKYTTENLFNDVDLEYYHMSILY